MRSRADSLPSAFWRSRRSLPPPSSAARFISMSRCNRSCEVSFVIWLLDDRHFLPIFQKLLDAAIRQRMFQHLFENFCWKRADIGTHESCLDYMDRMANGRHENLGLELVIVVDLKNIANEIHAVLADVVETTHKRANEVSAGFGGQNGLRRGKHQGYVDAYPFVAEAFR